jgi:glycerol-3-phosphate O-acyltransferase / dihydroxyacetone phosphate acyltransferase
MADLREAWRFLARSAAAVWFRQIEVVGRGRLPTSGPVLVVASHFNGLLDPVLVAAMSPRLPRFLGKATLWRNPLLGRVLDSARALPVYRPSEGSTARNEEMFSACYEALVDGDSLAVFPEGTTHDRPQISQVRTGAARIALGARQSGAKGLLILPVGLVYTAKASPRSRALVRVGEPIDLDRDLAAFIDDGGDEGPENADAVRRLTEEIRRRLADAALDYDDADAALIASQAAAIALRPIGASREWEPSLDERERCARGLANAPPEAVLRVIRAFLPYHDSLTMLGLSDAHVVAGDLTATSLRWRVGRRAAVAAATPAAVAGVVVNGPAVGLVWAAGRLHVSTPMRGTARLLAGASGLLTTWVALRRAFAKRGLQEPTLAALAAGPGCGLVALGFVERLKALGTARESAARLREHAALVPTLWAQRAALVSAVEDALAASGGILPRPANTTPGAEATGDRRARR